MATALGQFMQAQSLARARNQSRLNKATALYDSIIAEYSQGEKSPLMQAVNKQLEIGGRKAVSQGMQSLVNAGLSGSTAASGLGTRYEEEVAAPTRLNALDTISQRLASAQMAKAGLLERVEDTVDTSQLGNLMMAASSGGGSGESYGFGADAKVVSASSYLQPQKSSNEIYYGSSNPNAYNPYAAKPTISVRDGYSTKNLQASLLSNAKPVSNIYYGSSNKNAATLPSYYFEPIKGKTSQGNVTQYIDW